MSLSSRFIFGRASRRLRIVSVSLRLILLPALCLLAEAGGSLSRGTAGNPKLIELAPGATIVREITAGATDAFEASFNSGELLQVSIEKGDLPMAIVIHDPAGQKSINQLSRGYEQLEFSLPTDSAGRYRLEITSLEKERTRQYQLKLEPIRNSTTADRIVSTAQRLMAEASLLRADWTERSFREAVGDYDKAGMIWRTSRDFRRSAIASMKAGRSCFLLGDYKEALKRYQSAAKDSRAAGARFEESVSLGHIGRLYSYLGDNDRAQTFLGRALTFLAEAGTANQDKTVKRAYAEALSNLGEVNYSKGDLVGSSENFEHALKLSREAGDRLVEARVHLFKGYITGGIGNPVNGVEEVSQALTLYRAMSDKTGEGLCLTALGISYSLKGDEEQAIKVHREANAIFRTIGDRQSEAVTLNALGQAYELLKDYPAALESFQQALRLLQNSGALDIAAVSMFKVARIYRLTGDNQNALAYYEKCLKLSRAARKRRTEANALNEVALIYDLQGSREKTISQYRKILKFYGTISDRRGQATALNNLGDFLTRRGEKQEALDSYRRALPLSEQAGDKDILISTLFKVARGERDLGALVEARSHIERSIKIIEDLRTSVASPDFRTSYFAGVRKQYELYIDILMKLDRLQPGKGFGTDAFLASERSRARSLIDLLTEAQADVREGADPQLLEKERELRGLLRSQGEYQMDVSSSNANSVEAQNVKRQIEDLRSKYRELEARLRKQSPRFLALAQAPRLNLSQIQAELRDGDSILLEYALGDDRSYLWAVTRDSFSSYELPRRATLEDAGREVYRLLTARQTMAEEKDGDQTKVAASDVLYYEKAYRLSQMILGPVAEQIGQKRLLVVTEGMLQYVPLDALPLLPPEEAVKAKELTTTANVLPDLPPVIATHEIVTLPSIATLAAIRQERRRIGSEDKIVAVLADPVFSTSDDRVENHLPTQTIPSPDLIQSSAQPALRELGARLRDGKAMRLAYASAEADAILESTPRGGGMAVKGFDARRETAMSTLVGEYRIVHFATHGFLNAEHPELSGIVLTMVNPDGSRANGFMPLQDIYNLNLSADLVVLSACDTALGKDIKGEGLVSLTRGFISAGSKSVVASLWKVDDRATAALMAEFYKGMLQDKLAPAAALRSAKEKIRGQKAWSAPYFWAGFVLQGEYRDRVVVEKKLWPRNALAGSLALILISFGVILLHRRRRRSLPGHE